MLLSFEEALRTVRQKLAEAKPQPTTEALPLDEARARILAEDALADRDFPPFDRSTRDGYAVRSRDVSHAPVWLECVGLSRAGHPYPGNLNGRSGCCVEIMTGAPLPDGADAVVMVEHTSMKGTSVEVHRAASAFENVVRRGSEASRGSRVLPRRRRLGAGEIGLLASLGRARVQVFRQPVVAIIPTGDEVVPVGQAPEWFQVRNSNAMTMAAQVAAAGGVPRVLDIAPDRKEALRHLVEDGLKADLLLLSGGVSAGKYDLVEEVLRELGAETYFHGVAIRPGKPLAFGRVRGKFFFGLPGNPVSTFVTLEVFARPVIGLLGGAEFERPVFLRARLGEQLHLKTGLTTFMPARVEAGGGDPVVKLVAWQGSGDLVGVAAANCFLVIHPDRREVAEGDWVDVLWKGN